MHTTTLLSLLLPFVSSASPLSPRQPDPCIPSSYTITNFHYTSSPSTGARILFTFQSRFSNPSIIDDAASTPGAATCDANARGGVIPNSNECSTGRRNLSFDLRGPQECADFQIVHSWRCNGQEWLSSTHRQIDPLSCSADGAGTMTCTSTENTFQAENVRRICNTPTCP